MRYRKVILVAVLSSLVGGPALWAQANATLQGKITDTSGAPLPGAVVSVTGDRGSRTATADRTGSFQIPDLPPGNYRLHASLDAFAPETRAIELRAGQTAARSERHVIAINTHGRRNATSVDAAHCETRRTRFGSGHRQARDQRREVLKVLDTPLFQRVAGENRDRRRNLHQCLRTLLRCHDNLFTVGQGSQPEVLRQRLAGV